MNVNFFKRRYLDMRLGGVTINPMIQAFNFVMISYTVIILSFDVPFWIYAPVFVIAVFGTFSILGLYFRKIQLTTDEDLKYEKQKELNKTFLEIMKLQLKLSERLDVVPDDTFTQRFNEIKKITEL